MVTVSSPPSSLSCLQSLAVGGVGSSSLAALTPSLANHYRDDLVNHVRGWPADVCEKQVSFAQMFFIMCTPPLSNHRNLVPQ